MQIIANGVHELRLKDRLGQYRIFYYTKSASGLQIFHAFDKKSRKTPEQEIWLAKIRLKGML